MLKTESNQKGSSLIEVLGVISIVGILAISALKIITNIYELLKVSLATSEIKDLQKNISGVYNYSGDYEQLFLGDAYKTLCETDKVAPNQMCVKKDSSYVLKHRLSGSVVLDKSDDSKGYTITFGNLSKKNCVKLSQIEWLDRKKISIYQIDINETEVAHFPKKANKEFPITATTSSVACNKKENSITWYFY